MRQRRTLGTAAFAFAIVGAAREPAAEAHVIGLSTGKYTAIGNALNVEISFAQRDLLGVCPMLDRDHDGAVSPGEIAMNQDCLALAERLVVRADGTPCEASPAETALAEGDAVLMHVEYSCSSHPIRFAIDDEWLAKMPSNHRHVARAEGRASRDYVLDPKNHEFEIEPPDATEAAPAHPDGDRLGNGDARGARKSAAARDGHASDRGATARRSFFSLGVFHILTGWDHLIFLFGLLLAPAGVGRASLRDLVLAVTAFSVGHSLSLLLCVAGILAPSARVVEPLIAASIAFIGAENAFARTPRRRWLVTLPFGFIHGFGFADALRAVLGTGIGTPLFTFNAGVEVGQLLALTPMIGVLLLLQRSPLFASRGRRVASLTLLGGGVALFVARIVKPGFV